MGDLLAGRNILIMGVRNKWSIAWGIAQAAYKEGANIIYTYLGEREKAELEKLTEGMGTLHAFPCDVTSDEDIEKLFDWVKSEFGVLHGLVHAIAFARSEDLQDSFLNTGREGFKIALDISAYSLVAVCRHAAPLMTEGGSIITLTYRGSVKVTPEASVRYAAYELGGKNIRVNSLSAGPIKTLSAKGVKNFSDILKVVEERTPLKRNVTLEDLGKTAVYLLSDLSSGVTGEVIYVDSGYNNMGL